MKKKVIKKCQNGDFITRLKKPLNSVKQVLQLQSDDYDTKLEALKTLDTYIDSLPYNQAGKLRKSISNYLDQSFMKKLWYSDSEYANKILNDYFKTEVRLSYFQNENDIPKYEFRFNENNDLHKDSTGTWYRGRDLNEKFPQIFESLSLDSLRNLIKYDYIGGTTHEARVKFWNKNPEILNFVNETAKKYNISPQLLQHRLSEEGFVDREIRAYNNDASKNEQLKKITLSKPYDYGDGFVRFGLDNTGYLIENNLLNLRDDVQYYTPFSKGINESGEDIISATGKTLKDNIILQAATLEYLQKLMKERGYPENQLDVYTNAAYKMGAYHKDLKNSSYIQKNYNIPNYEITTYRIGGILNNKKQLIPKNSSEKKLASKHQKGGLIQKFQKPASPIKRLDVDGLRNDPEYKKNFNWKMHDANLALIQDSLISRNADFPERVAILGQVIPESGGYTEDHGNGAAGYVGWRGPRAVNLPKDAPGQAHKLMSEIYDNPTAKDWSHGGTGTGVQTGKEMMNLFLNTQNVQQAGKAFMKGYVRPEKSEWEKRLLFLNLLKKYMK